MAIVEAHDPALHGAAAAAAVRWLERSSTCPSPIRPPDPSASPSPIVNDTSCSTVRSSPPIGSCTVSALDLEQPAHRVTSLARSVSFSPSRFTAITTTITIDSPALSDSIG